jgi:hypothetical protein
MSAKAMFWSTLYRLAVLEMDSVFTDLIADQRGDSKDEMIARCESWYRRPHRTAGRAGGCCTGHAVGRDFERDPATLTRLTRQATRANGLVDGAACGFVIWPSLCLASPVPHVVGRHTTKPSRVVRATELAGVRRADSAALDGAELPSSAIDLRLERLNLNTAGMHIGGTRQAGRLLRGFHDTADEESPALETGSPVVSSVA